MKKREKISPAPKILPLLFLVVLTLPVNEFRAATELKFSHENASLDK